MTSLLVLYIAQSEMDFDLLGADKTEAPVTSTTRRTMLVAHQVLGVALVALMAGAMVSGQLNYSDRFGGPQTARFGLPHKVLAYGAFGTFLATGALALFAPSPVHKEGFDRIMLHRIALFGATAGMVAQVVLGVLTSSRSGYLDQAPLARAHLGVGYATLGLLAVGVGALIF